MAYILQFTALLSVTFEKPKCVLKCVLMPHSSLKQNSKNNNFSNSLPNHWFCHTLDGQNRPQAIETILVCWAAQANKNNYLNVNVPQCLCFSEKSATNGLLLNVSQQIILALEKMAHFSFKDIHGK